MLPRIPYANILKENLVMDSIKGFFKSKKTPITMSPESKLLVIYQHELLLLVVLSVFDKSELIFVNELFFIHEIKHIIIP